MHNSLVRFFVLITVACAFCLSALGQDVIISEFLASNPNAGPGLVDEDRERSDWIEIYNRGTNLVDLWNWSLTDEAGDPTKWRFPSTNIAPGQFLVVFASNKDRKSGTNLHTNFRLSANGGYLGLIRPDGSVASEFNPYPPQVPSVSFGPGAISIVATNISSNSLVRILIPTATTPADWAANTFSDSSWTLGTNGVGFGSTNAVAADYSLVVGPTAPVGYWRLNEPAGSTTVTNTGSGANLDGTPVNTTFGVAGPRPAQFGGFENNNTAAGFNGTSSSISSRAGLMDNLGAFTVAGWIRPSATPGARIGLFGQNDCIEFGFIGGTMMQCWTPGGGSVDVNYPHPVLTWHHVAAVGNGSNIRIFIDGNQVASGGTPTASYGASLTNAFKIGGGGIFDVSGNFFNGQIDEVVAYHRALSTNEIRALYQGALVPANASALPYVRTHIGSMMSNINASAYIRIPFTVPNPTNVALVTLRVRYDDGFAAFINGVEVARGNAPDTLSYNAAATNSHTPAAVEEFRLGALNLVPGANVLAIHGLNLSAADTDFLIAAELITTSIAAESPTPLYFTVPTPRAVNAGGAPIVGPAILEPQHTPNVPTEDQNLLVTARVSPTFNPVASVIMRYRVMFTNEIELTMFDDGLHGDGAAGDLVYGATIPASASTNGQMIRWYIRATDTVNNVSRWPIFTAADQTEYLGTIVEPIGLSSKLPIIHVFAPPNILGPGPTTPQTAADSQTGSRGVSVFHDGEFYDNIHVQVRGNTTASYNKKSHRFEFNADHPFRHGGPGPRIRRTSFVADYPDPTYMRQGLCYWLGDLIGCPSPFYIPHRLQLNGRFYQLANHNDVSGEEMLARLGYDERGALYNAAGQVTPGRASTGGFEKRTRRWDNDADYDTLAAAVAETRTIAQRRTNVFEMLDLPQVIDYLVTARWAHENDDVWANMSLYHDNDGDNLWRIVPFDMNLSWGAIFYEGGNPLVIEGVQSTNDIHKAHPLYGSSQALPLSGPGGGFNRIYDSIFLVPETRQMYLRRLRSMLDTYVGPIGTPAGGSIVEQKIIAWRNLIAEEATRDRAFWGWPAKGGQCNFDPGITITNGVNQMLTNFVMARRNHFYGKHSVTNTALPIGVSKDQNAGIPLDQPFDAIIQIVGVEFNPGSSNQAHEFICLTNPQPFAIDISDWRLTGGVEFTFRQGTVIPSNNVVYVSPDVRAFRARPTTPRGNQGHFIVGPYRGQLSARGEGVGLEDQFGRPVHSFNYTGAPSLAQQFLRVSEIMYNPAAPLSGPYIAEDFEFIELINTGPTALNLANVRFTEGIQFNFTGSAVTTLAPGQRVAVVRNTNAFTARYGAGLAVAGQFVGTLDSAGERIQLVDGAGENILDFEYNNGWYPITDGHGFSLILANQSAEWFAFDDKTTWRPGFQLHGTPAAPEPVVPGGPAPIVINEVLTHTDPPLVDFVELYNPLSSPVSIGGWFLTDDFVNPKKYRIPAGAVIPAGGYLSFDEADFNPTPGAPPSFTFSSFGDEVFLFAGDAQTNLAGYAHGFDFGDAENGVSFGRYVTSTGAEHFVPLASRTEAAANSAPKVGPIIISEIMYNPSASDDDSLDEFIELQNTSGATVNLFDPAAPTNTWNLDEAVEFNFPQGTSIPAGGFLLVVNFSPTNTAQLSAFRARYGVSAGVPIIGPFDGRLANEGERLELRKPNPPETNGEVRYVIVERVDYRDSSPWPIAADGAGASLHRRVSTSYYNDPTNWVAALPSPGAAYVATTPPQITTQPISQNVVGGTTLTLSVTSSGSTPLSFQWSRRGEFIAGATNATLVISNLHPSQRGEYAATVFNTAGFAVSSNAVINVLLPVRIFAHPGSIALRGSTNSANYGLTGSNVTFAVQAASASGVSYQWRFNDIDIPGATNSSLMVSNATLADVGTYQVRVTDAISSLLSAPATLTINIPPIIYQQPQSIVALAGDTVHFIANVGGTGPMTNRWQRNGVNLVPPVNSHVLTFTNVQPSNAAAYRIIISNAGNTTGVASSNVTLTVLADDDGDHMADMWETNYGFVVGVPDGAGDADNDGVKNSDEYAAGTDPRQAQSVLRVEDIAVGGGVQISFMATSNKTYTVQYKNDLSDPTWQKVTNVMARAENGLETVIDQTGSTRRFYRLVTPYQP